MILAPTWRGKSLVAALVFLCAALSAAVPAGAATPECGTCTPWWHLSESSRPSYFHHEAGAGPGRNEVLKFTTENAKGGKIILENPANGAKALFSYNASAETVRAALEERAGKEIFGAGNVEVTGGPAGEPEEVTKAEYFVTFKGKLAGKSVAVTYLANPEAEFEELGGSFAISQVTAAEAAHPDGVLVDTALNIGTAATDGSDITLTDGMPPGLRAMSAELVRFTGNGSSETVECSLISEPDPEHPTPVCSVKELPLAPFEQLEMRVKVLVEAAVPATGVSDTEINTFSASGGGVREAVTQGPVKLSEEAVPFGFETYALGFEEEGGERDQQAGSHPFQTTFTLALNQGPESINGFGEHDASPVALPKDVYTKLPPGLIGNPQSFPQCSLSSFFAKPNPTCQPESIIGVAVSTVDEGGHIGLTTLAAPIYNLEPQRGEPARFGFLPLGAATPVYIDASVRTGEDYGVTGEAHNITQEAGFLSSVVTLWGVPGALQHNSTRGYNCLQAGRKQFGECQPPNGGSTPPFFQLPTSCERPLASVGEADPWSEPGNFAMRTSEPVPALHGCNRLKFAPTLSVSPDSEVGSSPIGLKVKLHIPQEEAENPTSLAESAMRDISVTLPKGVAINPAAATGLEACPEALIGFEGYKEPPLLPGVSVASFAPRLPVPLTPSINFCAEASKIGTVKISTPLLPNPLEGSIFLASQDANPFGSLVAMYIVAEDPISGVLVKIPGEVELGPEGQITTTITNNPQVGFEDAELQFFTGPKAALTSPARCGTYQTVASVTPWSGAGAVSSTSSFRITHGANGTPCPGTALPFAPKLQAGTSSVEAGGYSSVATVVSREDGQQAIHGVQVRMPAGVSGILKGVSLCDEAHANAGTCSPSSLIGETSVEVGVGSQPYTVPGGKVYLTEAYAGAPFGLSVTTPAKAGPYDLENETACDCLVVRARVDIDPRTAALTVTADTSGAHQIPSILKGIPLEVRKITVVVNRPGFTFAPTDCEPTAATGVLEGNEGATDALSSPFQVTDCSRLSFGPKVTVSTGARASRLNGASLKFKLAMPGAQVGKSTWLREIKVDFPKQLPARLETLHQACLSNTFETNRGACPAGARIGSVVVHTPALPVPLTGPAYFVSYGSAKFPEVVFALTGYGIKIDLHGETFVNGKTGVTSATFRDVPDVPFESAEVSLPSGRYSEFGANLPQRANYNFCGQKLRMPAVLRAQNGDEIKETVPLGISGCGKTLTRAQKLARALKSCKKKRADARGTCAKKARKLYGAESSRSSARA